MPNAGRIGIDLKTAGLKLLILQDKQFLAYNNQPGGGN